MKLKKVWRKSFTLFVSNLSKNTSTLEVKTICYAKQPGLSTTLCQGANILIQRICTHEIQDKRVVGKAVNTIDSRSDSCRRLGYNIVQPEGMRRGPSPASTIQQPVFPQLLHDERMEESLSIIVHVQRLQNRDGWAQKHSEAHVVHTRKQAQKPNEGLHSARPRIFV